MESTVKQDQTKSSYTLHIIEKDDGKFGLVAIDDRTNYQVHDEYDTPSAAALEGIIALTMNRLLEKKKDGTEPTSEPA